MKNILFMLVTFLTSSLSCTKPIETQDYSFESDTLHPNVSSYWILYATFKDDTYQYDNVIKEMITREAPNRDYLVLNAADFRFMETARAANPNIKLLVYKNLSSVNKDAFYVDAGIRHDYKHPLTGVGFVYADTTHPEWFLKDENGERIFFQDYPSLLQMDVGDPLYQQEWSDNVIKVTKDFNWDGVFIDDVLFTNIDHHRRPPVVTAKYPTNDGFQDAYTEMLHVFKTKCAAQIPGKILIGNMMADSPPVWKRYLNYLDGAFDERWIVGWGSEILGKDAEWTEKMDQAEYFQDNNKILMVQSTTPVTPKNKFYYAYASYLMVKNPANKLFSYSEMETADEYGAPSEWRNEYNWNLGSPTGRYTDTTINNVKIKKRNFTKGVVFVNANSESSNITIEFDKPYFDENGQKVIAVSIPALTGRILRVAN